jgi:ribonucleoside-triphosphate reductase
MTQTGVKLEDIVTRIHKYQYAFRKHFEWFLEKDMLPVYKSGLIELDKQFLTIGLNGILESAEYLGHDISVNPEYMGYLKNLLGTIKRMNTEARKTYGIKFNTEIVPAENLGVKNAKWDKKAGLKVNRDVYNSYLYKVEDELPLIDKLMLHGGEILDNLDGGSAVHWNSDERKTKDQYSKVLSSLITTGSNYFCENVKKTCCNKCGAITANTYKECPVCGSSDIDYATRVIGYLKRVKNFSSERRIEEGKRRYNAQI